MGRAVAISRPGIPRRDKSSTASGAIHPKCYAEEALDDLAHRGCDMAASVHFTFILDISRPILKHGSARFWYLGIFENSTRQRDRDEQNSNASHLEMLVQGMACRYRPRGYAQLADDASKLRSAWDETGCSSK